MPHPKSTDILDQSSAILTRVTSWTGWLWKTDVIMSYHVNRGTTHTLDFGAGILIESRWKLWSRHSCVCDTYVRTCQRGLPARNKSLRTIRLEDPTAEVVHCMECTQIRLDSVYNGNQDLENETYLEREDLDSGWCLTPSWYIVCANFF